MNDLDELRRAPRWLAAACARRNMGGRGGRRGGGGGRRSSPTNTQAPVLGGGTYAGSSPAITPGTWSGSPTLTYSLEVNGVQVVSGTEAEIEAYVYATTVSGNAILYEIPNSNTSARVASNTVAIFSPYQLTPAAWYRETYAGGTWSDLSGNGRHLPTVAGSIAQVTRAGRLALSFNGSSALQGAFGTLLTQPTTVYVVWEATSVAATQVIYDGDDATNRIFEYVAIPGPTIRAGAPLELVGGAPSAGQIYGSCTVANGASSAFYGRSDFVTAGATGNIGTTSLDGLTVGARFGLDLKFTGYVWELIVYAGAHNAATRKQIGDYLTARYSGLTVTT